MRDCVFCKIINKELPSDIVYENDFVVAFKNIEPVATHHILICPKKHVENFLNSSEEILEMASAAKAIINNLNISNGYKLVFNGGKYQSVPHLHWHLLAGKLENNKDLLNDL